MNECLSTWLCSVYWDYHSCVIDVNTTSLNYRLIPMMLYHSYWNSSSNQFSAAFQCWGGSKVSSDAQACVSLVISSSSSWGNMRVIPSQLQCIISPAFPGSSLVFPHSCMCPVGYASWVPLGHPSEVLNHLSSFRCRGTAAPFWPSNEWSLLVLSRSLPLHVTVSQIAATLPASGEPTAGWTHVAYYVQSPFPALASG